MTTTVKIIADSVSPSGHRLTTFLLRYQRFIHAEFMTHKKISRNASSSRAIPSAKIIEDILVDPAMPSFWGKNQPGMQAREELDPENKLYAAAHWLDARDAVIANVKGLLELGVHKQTANRMLEPWMHINVLATATDWANFYELRCHPDAQPEFQELAGLMREAQLYVQPNILQPGEWHLPFADDGETRQQAVRFLMHNRITRDMPREEEIINLLRKVSTARCARTSYLLHDGKPSTVAEDLALHDKLVVATPLHASPAEHQATPDVLVKDDYSDRRWAEPALHGNLTGWQQHRKMLPGEFIPG
ncbi:FAD-dependent thymidylate synthase [Caballeronia sp. TF1N1]|uniref:FAD-dependent thymidylate synthase n=1 Tax=Caballeronia sp. TF1N1 TaxID=2878153 RepID=UPI001FD17B66|nr:FAD-dependent thymidylate synthase [Caballeronia sp. TF1N1]